MPVALESVQPELAGQTQAARRLPHCLGIACAFAQGQAGRAGEDLLVARAACAAYVTVINDLTDFKEDQASGKANRLIGKSWAFAATVLACCIMLGVAVAILWRICFAVALCELLA